MASTPRHDDSWIWILVIVVLVLLVPGVLMMGFWGTGMMGGTGLASPSGLVAMLAVAAVVIVAIVLLARSIQRIPPAPAYPYPAYAMPPAAPGGLTPMQILDARYARGEITRDEYLRMRQDLESRQP